MLCNEDAVRGDLGDYISYLFLVRLDLAGTGVTPREFVEPTCVQSLMSLISIRRPQASRCPAATTLTDRSSAKFGSTGAIMNPSVPIEKVPSAIQ
jgi:hypothetical protein